MRACGRGCGERPPPSGRAWDSLWAGVAVGGCRTGSQGSAPTRSTHGHPPLASAPEAGPRRCPRRLSTLVLDGQASSLVRQAELRLKMMQSLAFGLAVEDACVPSASAWARYPACQRGPREAEPAALHCRRDLESSCQLHCGYLGSELVYESMCTLSLCFSNDSSGGRVTKFLKSIIALP